MGGTADDAGALPYPLLLLTMLQLLLLELVDADAVAAGVLPTTAFCSVESSELLLP